MLYVNVTYTMPKENRDAFITELLAENIPELTRGERGNHAYDFSVPVEHEDQIYLREIWDEDAFDDHTRSENIMKLGVLKKKYGMKMKITISKFE